MRPVLHTYHMATYLPTAPWVAVPCTKHTVRMADVVGQAQALTDCFIAAICSRAASSPP